MYAWHVMPSIGRDRKLIDAMVEQHNGTIITHGMTVVEAWFEDEDDRDRFVDEQAAYLAQQKFLDLEADEALLGLLGYEV